VVGQSVDDNNRIITKINKFKPDILFVQYRPVQQEKWIDANRDRLIAKVAVGIGGTLDEFVGDLRPVPKWMEGMGLKWLWRLWLQPRRWRRMIDAVIVFPWLVFVESINKKA
jgi:N-acetylglucosaminyldiphosphoundecaprenol N-acetyl-beta-D-mannosaminyltransferase